MKTFLFYCLILLAPLWSRQTLAQALSTTNKKAIQLYYEGEELYKNRMYDMATNKYNEAILKDPNFVEAYYKLGSMHSFPFREWDKAKKCFLKVYELRPNSVTYLAAYYSLGEIYFREGDYATARKFFDLSLNLGPSRREMVEKLKWYNECCSFAEKAKQNPIQFNPAKMTEIINSSYSQAYPCITADQQTIFFDRVEKLKTDRNRAATNAESEDIVYSTKVNGQWTTPISISELINTPLQEGAPSISGDGKTLVFTSCDRPGGIGNCDLYVSVKEGNGWSLPINLGPNINSRDWDSEPSLSADGKTLYFSSRRTGGYGGDDIWVSTLSESGTWTPAKNLGAKINTKGNENAPFIHSNGQNFFFSSTFHIGMGGYDIFYSQKINEEWTDPINMGYPVNTHEDNGMVFITPDYKKGYYTVYDRRVASYPPSYLYEFDVPASLQQLHKSTYAKGVVYDAVTKQKLGARIELIDLKSGKTAQQVNSDKVNGDYILVLTEGSDYALYVSAEGYLFKSSFFDYKTPSTFNPVALDVYLDPIKTGSTAVLNNIFFATNSFQLEDKSKTELNKIIAFLNTNTKVTIELGGHTDDVGPDQANMDLSLKRAKAVYDYLITAGIPATRLKYKGYGETKPALPNTSDDNRQKNRRIEFKIL